MNYAIIVAAGKGTRMQSKVNKILMSLNGKAIIHYSIKPFEESPLIDKILIIANKDDILDLNNIISNSNFKKIEKIIEGGEKRQDSVYNGLKLLKDAKPEDIILIHNGANPFISIRLIEQIIKTAKIYGACAAAFQAKDTIKEADEDNLIIRTVNRDRLWCMQTPQAAKYKLLIKAFVRAYNDEYYGTDDVELIERLGQKVKIVECSRENFKITTPLDLEDAKLMMNSDRVGLGQDSHRFTDAPKQLVLGGLIIPNEKGLEANSDGDVILHSLFNALSQSVGGKSLGFYADELCKKGIKDSSIYLKVALDILKEKGFKINNIGIMIEAKKPRLGIYEELIKEKIASLCSIGSSQVGITATSGEELTEFGKGNAIQVFTIVSLRKQDAA
ncbi:MAG: 2-C-methyl-D-erythritol 4-phosphate cytidylyltransferase [Nanoarchaeota archaeon]|nr:2-C-methyl-D-erythritol 4-phosphate cytidylyltransferase [Nanoarchaeota archaeon]MBU1005800.1 2-C-methyl-D-erythritol 4-phosphate cytidylyltransferase [Nanoarchaeota archaeon]MBU1946568.1 2-C-methyl-D-erythritol 4-phosphate cytidylyltransferase [Nanoarchaeota archaeon]